MTLDLTRGLLPRDDMQEILKFTEQNLLKLTSSRILICGATGFVGTWLTSTLLEANDQLNLNLEIVIISRNPAAAERKLVPRGHDPLSIVSGDLASETNPLFSLDSEFTHIIHAATPTVASTGSLDQVKSYRSTVRGARNLVQFASHLTNPPVLLHTSSGAVYGRQPMSLKRIPEGWENKNLLAEISLYGQAKSEAEEIIYQANQEGIVRSSNPRLFSFFGPHLALDAHYAIGNFIGDAQVGNRINIRGNPSTTRSYLYPTDLVEWLLAILVAPTLKTIHVGSNVPIQMRDLTKYISDLYQQVPISILGRDASPSNYVPDISGMQNIYGVVQRVNLQDGLHRWSNWLRT